jgi:hypothetical protein
MFTLNLEEKKLEKNKKISNVHEELPVRPFGINNRK